MYATNAKKYYKFPQHWGDDWNCSCKGGSTHFDKSVCHYCGGEPPRRVRDRQREMCERFAREGGSKSQPRTPRHPTRTDTDREMEKACRRADDDAVAAYIKKVGKGSASSRVGGDGSSRSYREAAGGSPNTNNNGNARTPHTNSNQHTNDSNNTDSSTHDTGEGPGDGDSIKQAITEAKELVEDVEAQLKSATADAKKRSTPRLVRHEKELQQELEEAKSQLAALQNKTRKTSDRLEFTFKRIKQLERAQEKEVGKCRTAVTTIQAAEADWEAARKEHKRMADEIIALQAQADELRPPPQVSQGSMGGPSNLAEMAAAMRSRLQAIDGHPLLDQELRHQSTVEFAQFETFMAFSRKSLAL